MFRIPVATKYLLIINFVMFFFTLLYPGLTDLLGLHFFLASDFHIYQLVTYMFMHGGWAHILGNMFMLWMFGCVVENTWGAKRFVFYYISCGVGAGLCQEIAQFGEFYFMASQQIPGFDLSMLFTVAHNSEGVINLWTTVGASGALYAILLAFGMLYPNEPIFIFPLPIPIKGKWFVILAAGFELMLALGQPGDGVAHFAHFGGMLFGWLMIRYWRKHPLDGYGVGGGQNIFDGLRRNWENRTHRSASGPDMSKWHAAKSESDWEFNSRKKKEQDEIDRILDKIRKSGYDSLTKEEKRKLFDQSNKG